MEGGGAGDEKKRREVQRELSEASSPLGRPDFQRKLL